MKLIKNLVVTAVLLGASLGAQAANYNLGILSAGDNLITPKNVSGLFLDNINFTLTGISNDSFGVGALNFTVAATPFLNIDNLSLSLFDSSNTSLASGTNFSVNALSAGSYYLQVTGNANGVFGGTYAGGITVTPVPEVDGWATLLAGLGMLGFMVSRRRTV